MSAQQAPENTPAAAHHDEMMSALFAHMIVQQSNMALMLMGKVAHPHTGEKTKDLEAAKIFIDQLEMLEAKTKGNLSREEAALLKQTLMTLRMSFVEAVDSAPPPPAPHTGEAPAKSTGSAESSGEKAATGPTAGASEEEEHRKKFSKKY
jgi:hypothetical protein